MTAKPPPTPIKLPKKPRILLKEQPPDQRQFSVVPIRAITDRTLTGMEMRVLLLFCSYANRGGITWVGNQRIADHLKVSLQRAALLTRSLIAKGYMKVLYKGYKGERAHTRQIIFNKSTALEEIFAVSGEKPPYILEQEQREYNSKPTDQRHKGADKMARKKKQVENSVNDQRVSNLGFGDCQQTIVSETINEEQVVALQRAVGADLLQHALSLCGDNPTLEQVQTKLKELLS